MKNQNPFILKDHLKMSSGYSKTPLIKKLGIKPDFDICLVNDPKYFIDLLGVLPDTTNIIKSSKKESLDLALIFCLNHNDLETHYHKIKPRLKKNGTLWISWPKASSKVETTLTRDLIRSYVLANGLVDVKICSIDLVWSALKFVYRLKDRH